MTAPDTLTPGALASRLAVSDRTVRRMAKHYEQVFGKLPRGERREHRHFPPDAVARLEQAAHYMRDTPGASTLEVLQALKAGRPLPQRERTPSPDALAPLLAELRALRSELAELRALVLTLPGAGGPDAAPEADQPQLERFTRSQAELLERMKAGVRVQKDREGQFLELTPDGQTRRTDPRTVKALTRRGLLTLDGPEVRLNMDRLFPSAWRASPTP